jgi:uncharacterized protein YcfJ
MTLIFASNPNNGKYCDGWEPQNCEGGKDCGVCHDLVCTRVLGTCEDSTIFGGRSNCNTLRLWTKKRIKYEAKFVPCPNGDALRNAIIGLCGGLGALGGGAIGSGLGGVGGVGGGLAGAALGASLCGKATYCQLMDCETNCKEISRKEEELQDGCTMYEQN